VVLEHLATAACVDCGISDVLVLQFDHRERKTKDIAWLIGSGCPPRRLTEELGRCDVQCAVCELPPMADGRNWAVVPDYRQSNRTSPRVVLIVRPEVNWV